MKNILIIASILVVFTGGYYYSTSINENQPEYIKIEILDIAEIVATKTVADFKALGVSEDTTLLNKTFGRGNNLMHSAVTNKSNPQMMQTMIDVGVDINHRDADLRTPLHHAIDNDNLDATKILLENNADISIENEAGFSPLRFCEEGLKSLPNHKTCTFIVENAGI